MTFTLSASLIGMKLRCFVIAEDPTSLCKSQSLRNFIQLSVWKKKTELDQPVYCSSSEVLL